MRGGANRGRHVKRGGTWFAARMGIRISEARRLLRRQFARSAIRSRPSGVAMAEPLFARHATGQAPQGTRGASTITHHHARRARPAPIIQRGSKSPC